MNVSQFILNASTIYPFFNESATTIHHCDVEEKRKTTLAEGIAVMIAVVTILLNLLILLVIIRGPSSLKKPPYWFIASLAAADLLTGAEVITAIVIPVGTSPLSRIALKGLAVVTFIGSINSLSLVSFDRFIRIRYYAKYEQVLKERRAISLIIVAWIIAFLIFIFLPLGGWSCADLVCCPRDGLCVCKEGFEKECREKCSITFVPFTKDYLVVGVIYFITSIIFMFGFYFSLFQVVKKRTFERTPSSNSNSKKREIRLAKTLVITLGAFIICWLPVVILFLIDSSTSRENPILKKVFDICLIPSVINSCLNPIIYTYRIPKMKQILRKKIFGRCLPQQTSRYGVCFTTACTEASSTTLKTNYQATTLATIVSIAKSPHVNEDSL